MNKISKGKAVGLLSLGLASVALGSVGFASWVVSGTTLPANQNVTVQVADVQDNRVTLSASVTEAAVKLDADKDLPVGDLGITASGDVKQDLAFSVSVTATSNMETYTGGDLNLQFGVTMPAGVTTNDVYLASIADVTSGTPGTPLSEQKFTISPSSEGTTMTFTFTLAWGENFKKKNPVSLNKEDGKTLDAVVTALQALQTNMNNKQIVVAVTKAAA